MEASVALPEGAPPASQVSQMTATSRPALPSAIGSPAAVPSAARSGDPDGNHADHVSLDSAVQHRLDHAITAGFSGVNKAEPSRADITCQEPQTAQPAYQKQQFGCCHYEMKQFLECAQNQIDLNLCEGFSKVLKQCRFANRLA
ncbi:coiled-coil-helix-coiled-coil-helix domain-containing protein 2-like [Elephas maximus indicus]|uniref:coiled-coil-helix-coiled-coil-helix domain-containing protein 2-like n=1 Tax=Elephas maximus indicus TaxID=99487 RepID=UPI00211707A5|nr:coiled-coil-helix-coiled-coil-helix domain-containing protein 2-like [Elephas maximus indicus]